jgi:hypothetical protein
MTISFSEEVLKKTERGVNLLSTLEKEAQARYEEPVQHYLRYAQDLHSQYSVSEIDSEASEV